MIYQWIETIREFLSKITLQTGEAEISVIENELPLPNNVAENFQYQVPNIIHGETITDRKSVFQGHAATVHSTEQVR